MKSLPIAQSRHHLRSSDFKYYEKHLIAILLFRLCLPCFLLLATEINGLEASSVNSILCLTFVNPLHTNFQTCEERIERACLTHPVLSLTSPAASAPSFHWNQPLSVPSACRTLILILCSCYSPVWPSLHTSQHICKTYLPLRSLMPWDLPEISSHPMWN